MTALQGLALLLALQAGGETLARAFGLALPGPVVGLLLTLPLLAWGPVARRVEAVATVLLGHLSLLFVPVGVGVVVHLQALVPYGWKLSVVIVASTAVGMAVTALVLRAWLARGGAASSADGPEAGHG